MQKVRDKAMVEEDYEALKALSKDLREVFNLGKEIWAMKNELKVVIAKEDYGRAIDLKKRISKVNFNLRRTFTRIRWS